MTILFFIVAIMALVSAIGVISCERPVYSALWLVLNLFLVAVLYAMLNADFLAITQIIVYAGAIMVLVLFVIMLLGLQIAPYKKSSLLNILALLTTFAFLAILLPLINQSFNPEDGLIIRASEIQGDLKAIGRMIFNEYVFAFEMSSILLIAAVAGSIAMAKRRKV